MTSSADPAPETVEPNPGTPETELLDVPPDAETLDAEIKDFVEGIHDAGDIEPAVDVKDEALGTVARKTVEKAESTRSLVDELKAHLANTEVHGRIRNFVVPPAYKEVFGGAYVKDETGWFVQTVEWFKKEVARFSSGHFDATTVDHDILKLQAQMIYFSAFVNHMDAVATDAESTAKQAELRAMIEARQWIEEKDLQARAVNADILKAVARDSISDRLSYAGTAGVVSATVKGFYYALKDFISYLDRASDRAKPERHAARRA